MSSNLEDKRKIAVIIGGGPGGLTAAYELLKRTDIKPIIIETSDFLGGISCTLNYKGNRIDIGGHRFFSKSDRVMNWWFNIMPPENKSKKVKISYHGENSTIDAYAENDPEKNDRVMLVRSRKSRIYYLGKFFDYPISLSFGTLYNLGFFKVCKISFSYARSLVFPIKKPKNLEEFYINQFGKELYRTFFESYTEKVWGVPCNAISSEWGAQRVKGLSINKAIMHFFRKNFKTINLGDKKVETSLIENFLYPKFGPGQMWEEVAKDIEKMGGEILMQHEAKKIHIEGNKVVSVTVLDKESNISKKVDSDFVFSTMPVKDLFYSIDYSVPKEIFNIATNLLYRDFITVGILLKKLEVSENGSLIKDNWIYIQEPNTKVGRIQIFNNWSPYMVADKNTVWIGFEYFCSEGDEVWNMSEEKMKEFAINEGCLIGLIDKKEVIDSVVIRVKKTYPGYFGHYKNFPIVKDFIDKFENLFLIGRNGMHKYNNQDHSMLTAMTAVDNIISGRKDKSNIWAVNTEQDYHEADKKDK